MKILNAAAVAALCCLASIDVAGGAPRQFTGNVTGVLQVGSKSASTSVSQRGTANIVGVIQVSPKNSATIKQIGRYNAAGVVQSSGRGLYGYLP